MTQLTFSAFRSSDTDGHECYVCGKTFDSMKGRGAHIWQKHPDADPTDDPEKATPTCDHCGNDLEPRYKSEVYDTMFCDDDCQYAYQTGQNHPNAVEPVTRSCETCGDPKTAPESTFRDRAFCGRECYATWLSKNRSGPDHPVYASRDSACETCGDPLTRKPHEFDGRNHFCDNDCLAEWMVEHNYGPAHPQWTGGVKLTRALRATLGPEAWDRISADYRASVDACERDGCSRSDGLHTHHIVPVRHGGTNDDWNLMALCPVCHRRAECYTLAAIGDAPIRP